MPWQVGIDEAGYGPNLGPLVMAVVACRAPDSEMDLWKAMRKVVRRHGQKGERLLVADSKLVYTAGKGLCMLESSVLAFLCGSDLLSLKAGGCCCLDLVEAVCGNSVAEMKKEPWFVGDTRLPVDLEADMLPTHADGWRRTTQKSGLHWGLAAAVLVRTERFNGLVDRWGTKGAVLGLGLAELLQNCMKLPGDEPLEIMVDKHGGRNFYGDVLQHAFADGMVLGREEGADRSSYEVLGLARTVKVAFQPRADTAVFCVALASMVCKYLREVLMGEFNRFWLDKVPGLAPTAGYPGDSRRFYDAIQPALLKLGIERAAIWRER